MRPPRPNWRFLVLDPQSPETVLCDVGAIAPEVATVQALARLALEVRRGGLQLRLLGVSDELRDLIEFMGLTGALGV